MTSFASRLTGRSGRILGIWVLAALALSLVGSHYLGLSRVDVGLDVLEPGGSPPEVFWASRHGEASVPMVRVPDRFASKRLAWFELTSLGRKSEQSTGVEVWLRSFPHSEELTQDPPGSWAKAPDTWSSDQDAFGTLGLRPATIRWEERYESGSALSFLKLPWAGLARLRTADGEQELDLYAPTAETLLVPIAPGFTMARYYAAAPRCALAHLSLRFPADARPDPVRLYVGTLRPTVFDRARHLATPVWGSVQSGWQPEIAAGVLRLGPLSRIELGGWITVLALTLVLLAASWAGFWLVRACLRLAGWLVRVPSPPRELEPATCCHGMLFLLLAGPLVAVWLLWLAAFYPAIMTVDACEQWDQMRQMAITDHHSAFYALLMKLATLLWNTPTTVALVQVMLIAACVSWGCVLLVRARVPGWVVGLVYAAALFSPQNGYLSIALVKDTPYAICLFGATLLLAQALLDNGSRPRLRLWVGVGALLGCATLFRHNGIVVQAGMAVLLVLWFWPRDRGAVAAALVGLLTIVFVREGVYPAFDVQGRYFSHSATTMGWQIGALVAQDVPMAAEECEFLDRMRSFEDRWDYEATSCFSTIWGDKPELNFDFQYADGNLKELARTYFSLVGRNPLLVLRHVLLSNAYLYWPNRLPGSREVAEIAVFLDSDSVPLQTMESAGLPMRPIMPGLHERIRATLMPTMYDPPDGRRFGQVLWRPAFRVYVVLLALGVMLWRTRDKRLAILWAPQVLNAASLVLGVGQEVRFLYPLVLSTGFLAALAFLPRDGRLRQFDAEVPLPEA